MKNSLIQIFSEIDIGRMRKSNQDAFFTSTLRDGTVIAVVCDGMGGANAGNIASNQATKSIGDYIQNSYREKMQNYELASLLQDAIRSANITVYDMSVKDKELEGMGTTVVAAIVRNGFAAIAHVGDSRIYLVGDEIKQLTRDHSVVQSLIESGRLTPEEARVHPRRNVITRALGIEENIMVDCDELELGVGDSLLLCTDGLTNFVDSSDILQIFKDNELCNVPRLLTERANINGGGDNITVVTVTL